MNHQMFEELLASVREGASILQGKTPPSRTFSMTGPDIKQIRARYRLSQGAFAALLGISPATLRNWEQGRRSPEGPARVLLQIAARHPEALLDNISDHETRQTNSVVRKENRAAKAASKW